MRFMKSLDKESQELLLRDKLHELVQVSQQVKAQEVIDWWEGRCGDVIPDVHYQRLRPELYKLFGMTMPVDD